MTARRWCLFFSLVTAKVLFHAETSAQLTNWFWLNPLPQGNTLHDIVQTGPNSFVAVGSAGTIMKSLDGGAHWVFINSAGGFLRDLNSVSFIGTNDGWVVGDSGLILHTVDASGTWEQQEVGTDGSIRAVYARSTSSAICVGDSGSVFSTSDGGRTWIRRVAQTNAKLRALCFAGPQLETGYAVGDSGTILKTTNGGDSWVRIGSILSQDNFTAVTFLNAGTGFAVNSRWSCRTTDGGSTWASTMVSSLPGVTLNDVVFRSTTDGLVVGRWLGGMHTQIGGLVCRTTDGGVTWSPTWPSDLPQWDLSDNYFAVSGQSMVLVVGNGGKVIRSDDFGYTWSSVSGSTQPLFDVSFGNQYVGLAVGGDHQQDLLSNGRGNILRTADGGLTWTLTRIWWDRLTAVSLVGSVGHLLGENFSGGQQCVVFKSVNFGVTWDSLALPYYDLPSSVHSLNSNIVLAVTLNGYVLRTTDAGSSWSSTSLSTQSLTCVRLVNVDTAIAVGDAGTVFISSNRGTDWSMRTGATTKNLRGIGIAGNQSLTVVGDSGTILKSTDWGATWIPQNSPGQANLFSVAFAEPGTGIAVGEKGTVLFTQDSGVHWSVENFPALNNLRSVTIVRNNTLSLLRDRAISEGWYSTKLFRGINENQSADPTAYVVGDNGLIMVAGMTPMQQRTWVGTIDSSWFTPANWSPIGSPLPGDSVIIPETSRSPVIDSVQQQVVISSLLVQSGARLTITPLLSRFVVMADITVGGTLEVRPPAATSIVVGGKWSVRPDSSSDSGFIPASSTVFFTGNGTFERNFYNLIIDTSAVMTSSANITVSNQGALLHDVTLRPSDTLSFTHSLPQALVGTGQVSAGTIIRAIQPGQPAMYRFESDSTYVFFDGSTPFPASVAMTAYPNVDPLSFGDAWIRLGGTVDPVTHSIRIGNVSLARRKWAIGKPRDTDSPLPNPWFVRRASATNVDGDTSAHAVLSLRYDVSELQGITEDSLAIYTLEDNTYSVITGWNIVSLPVTVTDPRRIVVYPTSISDAFAFVPDSGYRRRDTLTPCVGYWLKFASSQSITIDGQMIMRDTAALRPGWNLIGSITRGVDTGTVIQLPSGIVRSSYFGYGPTGYTPTQMIQPGKGYWVKSSSAGSLVLQSPFLFRESVPMSPPRSMMDVFSTITFRDTAGGRQILLLGEARTTSVDIARYEMPPSPPAGVMDVRFMSGRMLELVDKSGDQEFGISVNSVQYPLKVEWSIADPGLSPLLVAGMQEILMTSKGSVRIVSAPSGYVLKVRSEINLPTQYALMQNYPNPFNPTTQICYDLPVTSHVVLKVYNILGQEVKTLKQGEEEAGRYTVQWNGTNNTGALVGSGVYLYRIEAKSSSGPTFMQTMKVVLLK